MAHAGAAISKIDEGEALKVFSYLKDMGEVESLKMTRYFSW